MTPYGKRDTIKQATEVLLILIAIAGFAHTFYWWVMLPPVLVLGTLLADHYNYYNREDEG